MDRRNLLKALAGLAICPVCTTKGFAAEGAPVCRERRRAERVSATMFWRLSMSAHSRHSSIGSSSRLIESRLTISSTSAGANILAWSKTMPTPSLNNGHTIQLKTLLMEHAVTTAIIGLQLATGLLLSIPRMRAPVVRLDFRGGRIQPAPYVFVQLHRSHARSRSNAEIGRSSRNMKATQGHP